MSEPYFARVFDFSEENVLESKTQRRKREIRMETGTKQTTIQRKSVKNYISYFRTKLLQSLRALHRTVWFGWVNSYIRF